MTLSKTTNFRLFQTQKVADDNLKFDENGKKLSNWVENPEGKREIACYEQFLLFPTVFSKDFVLQTRKKRACFGYLVGCMVFNTVFNSISVISGRPVQLSMLSLSSFNQYSAQYSFQGTGCFPTKPLSKHRTALREE